MSKKSCNFAGDFWRSVANHNIFLLTALAIIRIQKSVGNYFGLNE
jgi:hypothetical protein